jgi:membrane protease YdiL (CAAX protease family)
MAGTGPFVMSTPSAKLTALIRAIVVASAIALLPQGLWSALILVNVRTSPTVPWAVVLMTGLLVMLWRFLGGAFPPRRTADARRRQLRAVSVPRAPLAWALLGGGLSMVALTGYWIVLAQITRMPGNVLPTTNDLPRWMLVIAVLAGAAISPLCEQMGIWGYAQDILQHAFTRRTSIAISALIFAFLPHPPFGVPLLPRIAFFFLVGLPFGVIADATGSMLPNLPIHMLGLLAFFGVVWPQDPQRRLVSEGGANAWFVVHAAQAIVFTILTIMALRRLTRAERQAALQRRTDR